MVTLDVQGLRARDFGSMTRLRALYLLNASHPENAGKAVFFSRLGY